LEGYVRHAWGAGAAFLLLMGAGVGWAQTVASGPVFEVASVKESAPGNDNGRMMFQADGCTIRNMPLKPIISSVFGVRQDLISGLPGWAETQRFDIEAKEDEDTAARLAKLPNEERFAQQKLMMQALLEDRFKLKAAKAEKILPDYEMVIAKGGFKLKDADPNNDYANGMKIQGNIGGKGMLMTGRGQVTGQAVDLKRLAENLSYQVGRTVVDKTGLTGKYDFTLKWNANENVTNSDLPDFFTAIEEQLGLKLLPGKGPTETLVVDAVERPSGN
jgi:uncharacterized protein (TIGR03435 family)